MIPISDHTGRAWYQAQLPAKNQPDYVTLTLWGMYYTPDRPEEMIRIGITAHTKVAGKPFENMKPGDLIGMQVIFAHNPASLHHEEPLDEDINAKYKHKILKFRAKIEATNYEDIFNISW